MARYWQTLITATVLTEGDAPPTFDTLAHVHEAITDGEASGQWVQQEAKYWNKRGFDLKPDWIIFGGESGSRRRPVDAAWAEALQSECQEFNCAFFMKQMSASTPAKGKALIPAHLLIHEFPGPRIE